MKIELVQRSPEWYEFRKNRVGASDAPVIMGFSPYKTALQLYREHKGLKKTDLENSSMRYGNMIEDQSRAYCESYFGKTFSPEVFQCDDHPWLIASLDGLSEDNEILEVKAVNRKRYEEAIIGEICEEHRIQMLVQMYVSGARVAHYCAFHSGDHVILPYRYDEERAAKILESLIEFKRMLDENIEPAKSERDVEEIEDPYLRDIAAEYAHGMALKERLENRLESLREFLERGSSGFEAVRIGPVLLNRSERIGGVDYSKIEALKGIDLEKYRRPKTQFWKLKICE